MSQALSAQPLLNLSPEEARLISVLRDVPPGPVRERLASFLGDLLAFVREPHCAEMQADGVPCVSVTSACSECQQVAAVLAGLQRRLHKA